MTVLWRTLATVTALAFGLASCAPTRPGLPLDTARVSPDDLLVQMRLQSGRLRSMSGSGIVSFESPEIAGSATFTLALKKPDSLLVNVEGPFGIDLGFLFLGGSRFLLYTPTTNHLIQGKTDRVTLGAIVPLDLTATQILDLFSGVFIVEGNAAAVCGYTVEDDRFLLRMLCGADTCSYWVDPLTLLVSRFERRNAAGELVVEADARAVLLEDDTAVPRRIRLAFPASDKQVSVFYRTLTLNDPSPSFRFSIPADARPVAR